MKSLSYLDFDLKIEPEGEHYRARVIRSPAGEASNYFVLPFSEEKLENLILKISRLRASTRRINSTELEAARELGGKLFEAVLGNEVRASLRSSLEEVSRSRDAGLRIKLRLQDVPELADLPWEFLFDPSLDRFISQSNQTPIIRYIDMPERIPPLTVNLPLRILVMISNPPDYAHLNVEREKSLLQEALANLDEGRVKLEWLEKATLPTLQRYLRRREYHVFHFIGHGGFDKKKEEGVLALEDEQGRGWLADAHRIGTLLHDHRTLRLAVLNSCEGARNSRTDPFAGVAANLIRQGVPAVVAMQFEITDPAAIMFAGEFYSALADGFPVDAAVAEARKAIYVQPNDVEWGTPVLYMRAADGVLFNLQSSLPSSEKGVESELVSLTANLVRFHKLIDRTFNLEELRHLCFELNVDFDNLRGDGKTAKIRELVLHLDQRGRIAELVTLCARERPNLVWNVFAAGIPVTDPARDSTTRSKDQPDGRSEQKKTNSAELAVSRKPAQAEDRPVQDVPSEEGQGIEAKTSTTDAVVAPFTLENRRNGGITLTYNGHRIEIQGSGEEWVKYDGKEVSRKNSLFGAMHAFSVLEDGEAILYEVKIGFSLFSDNDSTKITIKRNNKFIYSD